MCGLAPVRALEERCAPAKLPKRARWQAELCLCDVTVAIDEEAIKTTDKQAQSHTYKHAVANRVLANTHAGVFDGKASNVAAVANTHRNTNTHTKRAVAHRDDLTSKLHCPCGSCGEPASVRNLDTGDLVSSVRGEEIATKRACTTLAGVR